MEWFWWLVFGVMVGGGCYIVAILTVAHFINGWPN
jgi:hypothetical protein